MNDKKTVALIILAVVFIAGLLFFVLGKNYETRKLEDGLKSQAINPITYKGRDYELSELLDGTGLSKKEEVGLLRLARYVLQARIEPKFALVGVNLEELDSSLVELSKSRDDIEDAYREYEIYRLDKELIYPLEYLTSQLETESLRRELINQPSYDSAKAYYESLVNTLNNYQKFMEKYLLAIGVAAEAEGVNRVGFYNGLTTATHMQEVFLKYADASVAAKKLADERWKCLQNGGLRCDGFKLPTIEVEPEVAKVIPEEGIENLEILESYTDAVYSRPTNINSNRSVGVLAESQCAIYRPTFFYYTWTVRSVGSLSVVFRPFNLNEVFVIDMEEEYKLTESPYNLSYLENGGPQYVHQPLLNYYMCPDLPSDVSSILRLDWLWQQDFPLNIKDYNNTSLSDLVGTLDQSYKTMHSAELVNESDASDYLMIISQILESDKNILSQKDRERLEDILIIYTNKNVGLPYAINSLVRNNNLIPALDHYEVEPNATHFLYLRLAPKLLLGGYTPNVIEEDVALIQKLIEADGDFLSSYSEIKENINKKDFIAMLIEGYKLTIDMAITAGSPF